MTIEIPPAVEARARATYQEIFAEPLQKYQSNIRLLVTDLEGTVLEKIPRDVDRGVVAPSLWAVLMHDLGLEAFALESILQDEWDAQGKRQYGRFVRRSVKVFEHYELKKDHFDNRINSVEYNPGVHEAMKEIHDLGIYTGMISGGFQELVDRAQKDLSLGSAIGACKFFWNGDGTISHCNSMPWDDLEKAHFLKSLMQELDARPTEVAYIGDSFSDLPIMRYVGLPMLINGADAVKAEVRKMENGIVVDHWSEVPEVIRNYPPDRIY